MSRVSISFFVILSFHRILGLEENEAKGSKIEDLGDHLFQALHFIDEKPMAKWLKSLARGHTGSKHGQGGI